VIERRSLYKFGHGAHYRLPNGMELVGSYHPSLRNTNTGLLNAAMFEKVFVEARELAEI
jgi:uracil-DNA glycosylase